MRNRTKQELDAFMFSGQFSRRSSESLEVYSKIAVFDIDDIENCSAVKEKLKNDSFIISVWISISGKGLKGLIGFDYNEIEKHAAEIEDEEINWSRLHSKIAFEQLSNYFKDRYHINLDISGRDISRLCFGSYDPELFIKETASFFPVKIIDATSFTKNRKTFRRKTITPVSFDESSVCKMERRSNQLVRRKMVSIIKYLQKRKLSITDSYLDWYKVGQAIANTFSYSLGKKYYLDLCRIDGDRHDEAKSIKKLIECYIYDDPHNADMYVGFAYLARRAKEKGWSDRAESTDAEKN